jgi:thiamine-monophosphate kinase
VRTVGEMGEFNLIDRVARLMPTTPAVVEGIGDDCAVLRVGGRLLLVSCDLAVENVHFRRSHASPQEIGRKMAAASLSDIAAMGGRPLFGLLALACPADTPVQQVEGLVSGMAGVFSRFGAAIVGGDTARCDGGMMCDLTVLGEAVGGRYLRRKGARAGDLLAVTGCPGRAAAGLHALENGFNAPELARAHYAPEPQIQVGQWLAACPAAHAMIDVSDGLLQDAGHLADASGLGMDVESSRVPIAPEVAAYCAETGMHPLSFALSGGEDYELLMALDSNDAESSLHAFHHEFRTEVTIIGTFTDAWGGIRVDGIEPEATGFDHFSAGSDGAS